MAVNAPLENIVLRELYIHISSVDQSLKLISDDDEELGIGIVRAQANTAIDKPHKVRIHISDFIGYGYDFTEKDEGAPAKEIYDRAVRNTKEFGNRPHLEYFEKDGVVEDRYGWYITRLG